MPAYKNSIKPPTCKECNARKAQYEVFNDYNASMGKMCNKCANKTIKRLNNRSHAVVKTYPGGRPYPEGSAPKFVEDKNESNISR